MLSPLYVDDEANFVDEPTNGDSFGPSVLSRSHFQVSTASVSLVMAFGMM